MSQVKTNFLTVAEAFSHQEFFEMVQGAIEYTETLLEEKVTVPFEDIVAELWTDETLVHAPKIDPYRLKQNQRSFVMRGLVWRLRDYLTEERFRSLAVSLPEGSGLRRLEESNQELLTTLSEGAKLDMDSDQVAKEHNLDDILEVAKLHNIVKKRTPTIWALMVAAGLSEDKRLDVQTLTDVRNNLKQRMDRQAVEEGRRKTQLTKEVFAQHLKLETRAFCRETGLDFDTTWIRVANLLKNLRGSRGPYKKTRQKSES